MKTHIYPLICILLVYLTGCNQDTESSNRYIISAPADKEYTEISKKGKTVIPNGRFITPIGKTLDVAPHPFGLCISPDGKMAITANSGTSPFSISIINEINTQNPDITQIPEGYQTDDELFPSIFMGLAVAPDNKLLYISGGETNVIYKFDLEAKKITGTISCNQTVNPQDPRDYSQGFIGEIMLNKEGTLLYGVDQRNFRLFIIDTKTERIIHNIQVGIFPFALAFTPNEEALYVANVGAFEYKKISSVNEDSLWETGLDFPVYTYLSKEMVEGIDTDTLKVPPLGDPNSPESFSVWKIDLTSTLPKVTAKIKTGILVGEKVGDIPAFGGSSPNSVAVTDKYVFVSNGHNDCISVIDIESDSVIKDIYLQPDVRLGNMRGIIPFGLTVSSDQTRLYVAEAGINAVAIIDIPSMQVLGHIPTGWFPAKVKLINEDRTLVVSNAKGYGSGPNGGKGIELVGRQSYIGTLMKGSVSVIDIPDDNELASLTEKVVSNNFRIEYVNNSLRKKSEQSPIPLYPGEKESPIKYFVYIVKENRTYDQVFGQLGPNGDPSIADYGYGATVSNNDSSSIVENVDVMVNHLKLAKEFAISDNFYCDGDHSVDGHWWLVNAYPNDWIETEVPIQYGGGKSQLVDSNAPGNLGINSSCSQIPEDYNEAGSMWEHLDRNDISFFNFGIGTMFSPSITENPDRTKEKNIGYKNAYNYPISEPLLKNTSRIFPTYNTGIPEQYRVDVFMEEFNERWMPQNGADPKEELPRVMVLYYGMDHGDRERPEDGYPYRASYMVDNDLALGRTVEFLSRTPYWKNMAIIVTEDDSQAGRDHIDAHRSIFMVISPYAKKNYIGNVHYSFGSIFKTFWHTLGIPCLNQYDLSANDLSDMFTTEPDFSPYDAAPIDRRIFDPELALTPLDENFNWEAVRLSAELDNVEDFIETHSNN